MSIEIALPAVGLGLLIPGRQLRKFYDSPANFSGELRFGWVQWVARLRTRLDTHPVLTSFGRGRTIRRVATLGRSGTL